MKIQTNIILVITLAVLPLLSGCALLGIKPTANLNVASPVIKLNGKSLDKVSQFSGTVAATVKTSVDGKKEVNLKSTGLWDFLGGFGVWFLVGGSLLLAAVISAAFFKAWAFAWSAAISGFTVLAGAFFFKLFWVYIAWCTAVIVLLALAFEIWKHRKKISAKNALILMQDIADNGKIDGSAKKK